MLGIRDELDGARPGAPAIAKDLASALFMMMLRAHLEASAPAEGLLRLLNQRMTAQAVLAMVGTEPKLRHRLAYERRSQDLGRSARSCDRACRNLAAAELY